MTVKLYRDRNEIDLKDVTKIHSFHLFNYFASSMSIEDNTAYRYRKYMTDEVIDYIAKIVLKEPKTDSGQSWINGVPQQGEWLSVIFNRANEVSFAVGNAQEIIENSKDEFLAPPGCEEFSPVDGAYFGKDHVNGIKFEPRIAFAPSFLRLYCDNFFLFRMEIFGSVEGLLGHVGYTDPTLEGYEKILKSREIIRFEPQYPN